MQMKNECRWKSELMIVVNTEISGINALCKNTSSMLSPFCTKNWCFGCRKLSDASLLRNHTFSDFFDRQNSLATEEELDIHLSKTHGTLELALAQRNILSVTWKLFWTHRNTFLFRNERIFEKKKTLRLLFSHSPKGILTIKLSDNEEFLWRLSFF